MDFQSSRTPTPVDPAPPRLTDRLCTLADSALRTLWPQPLPAPAAAGEDDALSPADRARAAALMRVNHVGEVCAQALYLAQAATARSPQLRAAFLQAAREEQAHLRWCEQRLGALGGRRSLLNPLWFGGALAIGLVAGRVAGDAGSLGFMAETERQVEQHLSGHLERLPRADAASRAVVARMRDDEAAHAHRAEMAGAAPLPLPARWAMRAAAKVMTVTAERI